MSWYQRTKLGFNSLRTNLNPRVPPKSRVSDVPSTIHPNGPSIPAAKSSGFSSISSISSMHNLDLGLPSFLIRTNANAYNPFMSGAKRFYYDDHHFKPPQPRRRITVGELLDELPAASMGFFVVLFMVSFALLIASIFTRLCYEVLKTFPNNKRNRPIPWKEVDKLIEEMAFEKIKAIYEGKILPATHPESIRVSLIAKNITDAIHRGSSLEHVWGDLGEALMESSLVDDRDVKDTGKALSKRNSEGTMGKEKCSCEVLVVKDPNVVLTSAPNGKILISTGLLEHFKTDAEIATIIGHEVGHIMARHATDELVKEYCIEEALSKPDPVVNMLRGLVTLTSSQMMEIVAESFGLLLTASAGYDPKVAPGVYEKVEELSSKQDEQVTKHPTSKARAQRLAQNKVMQAALKIYVAVQTKARENNV